MADKKTTSKKKILWIILALAIGFAIAMVIMTVAIYFGFTEAYRHGTDTYDVNILGLKIYELSKINNAYTGTAIGINMGILCMVCMVVATAIQQIFTHLRHK